MANENTNGNGSSQEVQDFSSLISRLQASQNVSCKPDIPGNGLDTTQVGGLMVYIYDHTEEKVIYATQDCRDLLGDATDALLSNSRSWILRNVSQEDRDRVFQNRDSLLETNGSDNAELYFTVKQKNQRLRLHRRESVLNRDEDGNVRQILGTLRDISRPSILKETPLKKTQLLNSIFDAIPQWVLLLDSFGQVILANKQARESFSQLSAISDTTPLSCLSGENCHCELEDSEARKLQAFIDKLREEKAYRDKKGIRRIVEIRDITEHCSDLADGYQLISIQDISQHAITEEKLRQAQGESAKLNKLLTDTLQKLAGKTEEAEQADRAKTAFLAVMSHELRTPMNAILGLGNLLLEDSVDDGQKELLATIVSSATNLLELIEHILEYAEHEAGNISYREDEFSLRDMIGRLKEEQQSFFEEKHLGFKLHIHDDVSDKWYGDHAQIESVLRNLFSNAVKFTKRGSVEVFISMLGEARQKKDNEKFEHATIQFSIKDTGLGISQDKLDQVFTPFFQVDSAYSRKYGGVGLGLTIARSICRNLRGRLKAESIEGKGSTFTFILPLKRQAAGEKSSGENVVIDLTGKSSAQIERSGFNVLLASEEVETHLELSQRIEQSGHSVESVRTIETMMRALNTRIFDVVIIDKQMQHLDLMALVNRIRNGGLFPQKRNTRIVVLAGDSINGAEDQTMARKGSFSWLTKTNLAGQLLPMLKHR